MLVWVTGGDPSLSLDALSISNITIGKTPIASLSTSSSSIPCGSTLPITFTVNTSVSGITGYTWNLGSNNNGWQYNGSTAPSSFTTISNQIQLTPICGSNLSSISATVNTTNGNYTTINNASVSITQPVLSINGLNTICSGSQNYTINNLPCNANVSWSISPTNLASLSCTNCSTATLTQIGNGDVTLTAIISNVCGSNYSETMNVTVGAGSPPTIYVYNYDNTCGTFAEAYCTNPANSTGFIWNFNYGEVIQNNPGYYGDYFSIRPIPNEQQAGNTYYNYLSVQATNACGVSVPSSTIQFTVGPISSTCGTGGGGKGILSTSPLKTLATAENMEDKENLIKVFPNPAKGSVNVTLQDGVLNLSNTYLVITDVNGKMMKRFGNVLLSNTIDMSNWASGTYFITITDGVKKYTKKIIRN